MQLLIDEHSIHRTIDLLGKYSDLKEPQSFRGICDEQIVFEGHDAKTENISDFIAHSEQGKNKFKSTQHVITNIIITINGETAQGIANLLFNAVHWQDDPSLHFQAGGIYHFEFIKRDEKWLIRHLRLEVLWATGTFDVPNIE